LTFVPPDFDVPTSLETPLFTLEPLGPQHSDADFAAWSSSREHIHATPGWEDSSWPDGRTLEANRRDLERHAEDFRKREGFTCSALMATRMLSRPDAFLARPGCMMKRVFGSPPGPTRSAPNPT
jgi:hypothetical protein